MCISKYLLTIAMTLLLFAVPAHALPDTAEDLQAIIQNEFGGDANTYIVEEPGEFRRMACRGRVDLIQQLLDEGLTVGDLPFRSLERFYECALDKAEWSALALVIDPQTLAKIEREANSVSLPLQEPVYSDDYQGTLLLLENGAHQIDNRTWTQGIFTEDGHRFLTVEWAVKQDHINVIAAFEDAGYGDIVADARIQGLRALLYQLATGKEAGEGFLSGLVDLALGVGLGAANSDFLLTSLGGSFIDSLMESEVGGEPTLSPDGIEMQLRLSRYLTTVDAPVDLKLAPKDTANPLTETKPPASTNISSLEELERLADLRDRGVLSEEEFEAMKARILRIP